MIYFLIFPGLFKFEGFFTANCKERKRKKEKFKKKKITERKRKKKEWGKS